MKDRFQSDEWEALKALPFHLFGAVASADGEIQDEEVQEFFSRLTRGAVAYKDPLHRELAREIIDSDIADLIDRGASPLACDPGELKEILQERLDEDEYQGFIGSLFVDALNHAMASKKGPFDELGIEDSEAERLTAIGLFWEVDLTPYMTVTS